MLGDINNSDFYAKWSIELEEPTNYDSLDVTQFKEVYNYIKHWFREAKKKCNASGSHCEFRDTETVQGKPWLVYYYQMLKEINDVNLDNLAYVQLSKDAIMSPSTAKALAAEHNRTQKEKSTKAFKNEYVKKQNELLDKKLASIGEAKAKQEKFKEVLGDYQVTQKRRRLMTVISDRVEIDKQLLALRKQKKKKRNDVKKKSNIKKEMKSLKQKLFILDNEKEELEKTLELQLDHIGDSSSSSSSSMNTSDDDADNDNNSDDTE